MYNIITGGSSGLGFELAKQLVEKGEPVIIIGRNKEKLAQATSALQAIQLDACVYPFDFDICSEEAIKTFIQYLSDEGIGVKRLFNVAGSGFYGAFDTISQQDIDRILGANFIGLMQMTLHTTAYMLKNPVDHPKVISILSTAALKGKSHETIYNAAKWGARGFLESMRDELKSSPIAFVNVFPGGMNTPFWEASSSGYPVEAFMAPSDVARQILQTTCDETTFVYDITINRPK